MRKRAALSWTLDSIGAFGLMMGVCLAVGQASGLVDNIQIRILLSILLAAAFVALVRWVRGKPEAPATEDIRSFQLDKNTKKFADFYSKWYGRDGSIYIFCNDLYWLEGESNASVVQALKAKSNRVMIFLRTQNGVVYDQLIAAGAQSILIPDSVRLSIKMSVRVDDGHVVVIIRDDVEQSQSKGQKNAFIETTEKYITDLVMNLLRSIDSRVL